MSGGDPGALPKRWLRCPRKSDGFIGGKFLAFKTPLDAKFNPQVPLDCRFSPDMLLKSMKNAGKKVGLWMDLTFTSRFYDSARLKTLEEDLRYVKLQCRGHEETPTLEQTNSFLGICSQFISMNPLSVVGVHCTHGFNRTGFLVVSYLVEKEDWSLDRALDEFSRCRPPGIYKQDYLDELHHRYGDPDDEVPRAPVRPEWCYDDNIVNVAPSSFNGQSHDPSSDKGPGQCSQFMEGVEDVVLLTVQRTVTQIQRRVQELCGWKKSGFPGSQPISMDVENVNNLSTMPYMVSWKADGTRYMMLIDGRDQIFMLDRDNRIFKVPRLRFPKRKDMKGDVRDTLVDGELVIDVVENQKIPRYLVYDIIIFEGNNVGKLPFPDRLRCIEHELINPRNAATVKGFLDRTREPFGVRLKPFYELSCAGTLLGEKFIKSLAHEPDGLIFQPSKQPYVPGRCDQVLKWKPHHMNSVDFRLMIQQTKGEGQLPETKGFLYVGSYERPFGQIKITKQLRKMHNRIIECNYDGATSQWLFMRERTDKSFPNGYNTAMAVCNSIQRPVTQEFLLDFIKERGFKTMPPPPPPVARAPKRPHPPDEDRD